MNQRPKFPDDLEGDHSFRYGGERWVIRRGEHQRVTVFDQDGEERVVLSGPWPEDSVIQLLRYGDKMFTRGLEAGRFSMAHDFRALLAEGGAA